MVHFYNDQEDTSLGNKLRQIAYNSIRQCFSCRNLNLKHDICYYHNKGYVEIRLKEDEHLKNDVEAITKGNSDIITS